MYCKLGLSLALVLMSGNVMAKSDCTTGEENCWSCSNSKTEFCTARLDAGGTMTITGNTSMDGYYADTIVPWAKQKSSITKVTIAEGITSVGTNAFNGAGDLTEVNLPKSLISIGDAAFLNASNLAKINLPDSLNSIGGAAFQKTSLTKIDIPENVTSIGNWAFSSTNVQTVNFLENSQLKTIGIGAFHSSPLITIKLPKGLEKIGQQAFYGSDLQGNLIIPDSVTSVGNMIVTGTDGLTSIIFSENSQLESLGENTFWDAKGLELVILPPNLQVVPGTDLNLGGSDNLQSLYLTPEQAQNISITGKSSTFAPLVYQIGTDGVMVSQNGREMNKYGSFGDMISGEWTERYEYSDDRKYGGLRQETYAKDGDGEKYIGAKIFRPDGSIVFVDENNKFINKRHAKIYTVEEAMEVTKNGDKFHVYLTYK